MQIYEIAVRGMDQSNLWEYGIRGTRPTDHYWRVRWLEDGEEVDQVTQFESLEGMARAARLADEPVAWRYYATGVFADAEDERRFLEAHGILAPAGAGGNTSVASQDGSGRTEGE